MQLSLMQTVVLLAAVTAGAVIDRFTPFLLFPDHKQPPEFVLRLGRVLPPAVMGLLVVYCLKDVQLFAAPHGLPEAISLALIAVLHFWRHNTLLSIAGGTACYMLLVQLVFV